VNAMVVTRGAQATTIDGPMRIVPGWSYRESFPISTLARRIRPSPTSITVIAAARVFERYAAFLTEAFVRAASSPVFL